MSGAASKHAFSRIKETCPAVDEAGDVAKSNISAEVNRHIDNLIQSVKDEATEKLRSALIDAEQELLDAQDRISELESEVARLEQYLPSEEAK